MAKYWEIIESYGDKSRKSEAREAYECGYEEGYEAAMKEMGMDQEMEERPDRWECEAVTAIATETSTNVPASLIPS